MRKSLVKAFRDAMTISMLSLGLMVFLLLFVVEPQEIKGKSMLPALRSGDWILVDKLFYKKQGLNDGDIIIFSLDKILYVKRIRDIGTAGSTLSVAGDNPSQSVDSRDLGTIGQDAIIGKALFIYWPLSRVGIVR